MRKGEVMGIDEARTLLQAADLFIDATDEDLHQCLNMNDVWGWACADLEKVENGELPELATLFKAYGWCGVLYWVSEKRGGCRSEFEDNNRFIDFVRYEETIRNEIPSSSARAYAKRQYVLGEQGEP